MGLHSNNRSKKRSDEAPIHVFYIMGAGRSGSTVLDTVLGNHPEIESVGELTNLPRSGWVNGEYCACGEPGNVCPFWSDVRREWVKRVGVDDVEGYLSLQDAFERFRQWPCLLRERWRPSLQFQAYAERTRALFEAICAVSGKSIIVDSSKNPARAFALSMVPGIDLYLIHLVRDGRGVAWSLKKAFKKDVKMGVQKDIKPRPVWRTAIFWTVVNLYSEWVRRRLDSRKSIQVRYEDFINDPKSTLDKIGGLIELDFAELTSKVSAGEAMEVGHTIAGNRLRMAGRVRLRPDTEWTYKLPLRDQRIFWVLAGWLMRQYGYGK